MNIEKKNKPILVYCYCDIAVDVVAICCKISLIHKLLTRIIENNLWRIQDAKEKNKERRDTESGALFC